MKRSLAAFFLAACAWWAGPGASTADAQGCTAARGCPSLAPGVPGSNVWAIDRYDQPPARPERLTVPPDRTGDSPEGLDVAPDVVDPYGSEGFCPSDGCCDLGACDGACGDGCDGACGGCDGACGGGCGGCNCGGRGCGGCGFGLGCLDHGHCCQCAGSFLQPGDLIVSYQWNYSDADNIYLGTQNLVDADRDVALVSIQNEHVAGFEYGVAERLSFVWELPFQYNNRALNVGPISPYLTGRLVQKNGGVADSRAYFRYWLYPCDDANVSVYVGLKVPTGNEDSGNVYQGTFLYDDISIQTGSGSWDPIVGLFMYKKTGYVTWFGSFNYRCTPSNVTDALALDPLLANPNSTVPNSIADQLSGDLGINVALGQYLHEQECWCDCWNGLSTGFAIVGAGTPERDLIGNNDGYRRAFNAVYLRPGVVWAPKDDVALYANLPITVHRDLKVPGSFADIQLSVGGVYYW
jgi:hypothetical protein